MLRPLGKSQRNRDVRKVASVAVLKDGQILFGRRNDNGKWTLPGGHLNPGESPEKGAVRELLEETGLKAVSLEKLGDDTVSSAYGDVQVFAFKAKVSDGEAHSKLDPDDECSEWVWRDLKSIGSDILDNLHSPKNVTLQLLGVTDLKKMAIKDIAVGTFSEAKKRFNYSHLLPSELASGGYELWVHPSVSDAMSLWSTVTHKDKPVGFVKGALDEQEGVPGVEILDSKVHEGHRGRGLGTAAYEALIAHAYHQYGVRAVFGDTHSTAADHVHRKLAQKHKLSFHSRGKDSPRDDSDYDNAYGPYSYTIKSTAPLLKGELEPKSDIQRMLLDGDSRKIALLSPNEFTNEDVRFALQLEDFDPDDSLSLLSASGHDVDTAAAAFGKALHGRPADAWLMLSKLQQNVVERQGVDKNELVNRMGSLTHQPGPPTASLSWNVAARTLGAISFFRGLNLETTQRVLSHFVNGGPKNNVGYDFNRDIWDALVTDRKNEGKAQEAMELSEGFLKSLGEAVQNGRFTSEQIKAPLHHVFKSCRHSKLDELQEPFDVYSLPDHVFDLSDKAAARALVTFSHLDSKSLGNPSAYGVVRWVTADGLESCAKRGLIDKISARNILLKNETRLGISDYATLLSALNDAGESAKDHLDEALADDQINFSKKAALRAAAIKSRTPLEKTELIHGLAHENLQGAVDKSDLQHALKGFTQEDWDDLLAPKSGAATQRSSREIAIGYGRPSNNAIRRALPMLHAADYSQLINEKGRHDDVAQVVHQVLSPDSGGYWDEDRNSTNEKLVSKLVSAERAHALRALPHLNPTDYRKALKAAHSLVDWSTLDSDPVKDAIIKNANMPHDILSHRDFDGGVIHPENVEKILSHYRNHGGEVAQLALDEIEKTGAGLRYFAQNWPVIDAFTPEHANRFFDLLVQGKVHNTGEMSQLLKKHADHIPASKLKEALNQDRVTDPSGLTWEPLSELGNIKEAWEKIPEELRERTFSLHRANKQIHEQNQQNEQQHFDAVRSARHAVVAAVRNDSKQLSEHDISELWDSGIYSRPNNPGSGGFLRGVALHPNTPSRILKEIRDSGDDNDAAEMAAKTLTMKDPDAHYKQAVHVRVHPGIGKLRKVRDFIMERAPKGEMPPSTLPKGDYSAFRLPNGNISAHLIQNFIDKVPTQRWNVSHSKWDGGQRHSLEPSDVFQMNLTTDHMNQMRQEGVYGTFLNVLEASKWSTHPVTDHTVGWVRYTGTTKPTSVDKGLEALPSYDARMKALSEEIERLKPIADKRVREHLDELVKTKDKSSLPTWIKNSHWIDKWGEDAPDPISDDELFSRASDELHFSASKTIERYNRDHEAWVQHGPSQGLPHPEIVGRLYSAFGPNSGLFTPEELDEIKPFRFAEPQVVPAGIQVDEVQSDFGQNFARVIAGQAEAQARLEGTRLGLTGDELEAHVKTKVEEHKAEAQKRYPDEHLLKISKILFNNRHPNEVISEAFVQHLRDKGAHDVDIHWHTSATKAPISLQRPDEKLPGHFKVTYEEVPKKLGAEPAKYGELPTQTNANMKGKDQWKLKVRKREDG